MRPRLASALAAVALAWAVVAVVTMTYGSLLSWPDYVHVNFGFPFTFATHVLSTVAGSVDTWEMDAGALAADLAFWFAGMTAIVLLAALSRLGAALPGSTKEA